MRAGQLLLEMDLAAITAAGPPTVGITVVTNDEQFRAVEPLTTGRVCPGEPMLRVLR